MSVSVGLKGVHSTGNGLFFGQYIGIIAVHVAFQLGFCTFVLSNYIRSVVLPLTRPALAALATLEVTFIYNDFFWALILMAGKGSRMPVTSALDALKGQLFVDYNLLGAGAILVAIPTLIVFFALQKQFISGLTLGSTKG